jgi:Tol biopolymer transport system component
VGIEQQPSFSPDGNYVVYRALAHEFENAALFVKQIGSETSRRLTSGAGSDISPKWSPDGRSIAFVRVTGHGRKTEGAVIIVPALGGIERYVPYARIWVRADSPHNSFLDWCPGSEQLIVSDQGPTSETASLFLVDSHTGERSRLTAPPDGGMGDFDPAVSADRHRLTFTRYTGNEESASIYLLDVDSEFHAVAEPRVLLAGIGSRAAVWMPNGNEIIFPAGPHHRKRLMGLRVDGGSPPRALPFAAEGAYGLTAAISRRNQIAYPVYHSHTGMYRVELIPQRTALRAQEFLPSTSTDYGPEYSPDGRQIAFVSNRTGAQEIWISQADGSSPYQLTTFRGTPETTRPRWSPDGRGLVFTGGHAAYVMDIQGGQPRVLLNEQVGSPSADWSRDGKWIYISSHRTGRAEIWKLPEAVGIKQTSAIQITRNGGEWPTVSPDGAFVYYTKGNSPAEVWRIPADGGPEQRIIRSIANAGTFAVTTAGIYFIPPPAQDGGTSIMFVESVTGLPRSIAPVSGVPMWGFAISPDRRYVLYVSLRGVESDLVLVNNFR